MSNFKLFFSRGLDSPVAEDDYIEMNVEWFTRHHPETGGYLVMYNDGYMSYSPAQPFEEGYTLLDS
ncbi:MAG: hypothetical protein AAF316_01020 [Cyanobacteria bacterium P01_A01_bin.80]